MKLKLKALEIGAIEVLTRRQLKEVLGGTGSGAENMICKCSDGHSAGMVSCDTCDKWCKDHSYGSKDTCD